MDAVASPFSTVLSLAMAAGAVAFGFLILKILHLYNISSKKTLFMFISCYVIYI